MKKNAVKPKAKEKEVEKKEENVKEELWNKYTAKEKREVETLAENYREYISVCKTERESVTEAVRAAKKAGYVDLDEITKRGKKLKAGDKVYAVGMKKTVVLYNIGKEPIENGMSILGAHIDTCRLDVKQNPLYESDGLAYFDTHYYGGIKKYQWVTIPLALHGVVAKKNGKVIDIVIGEKDDDPTFCVTDLLIHLAAEQMEKRASKVIEGEKLDILIGSYPLKGEKKDAVKKALLRLLKEKYGIEEDDFLSAELCLVPAGKARDMGLDRSFILGYGQDDRVCAFLSLDAMLEVEKPKKTTCCLLVDKEEIGSVGATSMQSRFFENTLVELLNAMGEYSELKLRHVLANSKMLSSDVNAGYDPLYASAFDKRNASLMGKGMVFSKFTGARGKSGSNDANAEFIGELRRMLDKHNVAYQLAELGKVDIGGGGTIAYIMSLYGMEVIDSGVAVLSMHAPWEVTSKIDLYETKKGYRAFLLEA